MTETHKPRAMNVINKILGFPGEFAFIVHLPKVNGGVDSSNGFMGTLGMYRVRVLLARPEHLPMRDQLHYEIGEEKGDSYIRMTFPKKERQITDIHQMNLSIGAFHITLFPNDEGYAGIAEIKEFRAKNHDDARRVGHEIMSAIFSAWSCSCDTPILIDMIETVEVTTAISSIRRRTDYWDVWIDPHKRLQGLSPMFMYLASLYREALTSNSAAYRFLCFYRVIEALYIIRRNEAVEAQQQNKPIRSFDEKIPSTIEGQNLLLSRLYPWAMVPWEEPISREQVFLHQVRGRSVSFIAKKVLRPMRDKIAHGLMSDDKTAYFMDDPLNVSYVETFLPIIHVIARLMMMNQFPESFTF